MGASSSGGDEDITGINVTPLVDVMLVLLIIFMVTANYINNRSIEIQLPKAASGDSTDNALNLAFVIDKESKLYLDGVAFSLQDLPAKIEELKTQGKNLQALIGADKDARHGVVVQLMDQLRLNGITDFAINIEAQ